MLEGPCGEIGVRIATWNVNSLRMRLDQVLAWLAEERPEVLCLQETKVSDDLFPWQPIEALGYRAVFSGQKAYNGVAILSLLPMEDLRIGFEGLLSNVAEGEGEGEGEGLTAQKRVISALIEGVRVVNLYVPNGASLSSPKYAYKLEWLACLERALGALRSQGDPLVVVGDFNIALEARDIHAPERLSGGIMASEAERQALRQALGPDLRDAFRVFEPASGHWSWWDYRSGAWETGRGWRIDHIYIDDQLLDFATGCVIHQRLRGNAQPSDHAPVVVHLAWPPSEADQDEESDEF
jgi:exodeoxyribonuclease-3